MTAPPPTVRARNAAATRAAILAAARARFAHDSYENVGVRDIASRAGVDAALVSRYFGSKEELFAEVLRCGKRGLDVIGADMDGMARRVADLVLDPPDDDKPLDDLLIMLHSASSPIAQGMVRDSIEERFHAPIAELLGGDRPEARARLFGALMMGLAISGRMNNDFELDAEGRERLRRRLETIIQLSLDEL